MKNNWIAADFETTQIDKNDCVFVYLWGVKESWGKQKTHHGTNIISFLEYIQSLERDITVFFHNGGGFDFHYLLMLFQLKDDDGNFIFTQHFYPKRALKSIKSCEYKEKIQEKNKGLRYTFLKANQYTLLANNNRVIISLKLGIESTKEKTFTSKGISQTKKIVNTITFKDSFLLFGSSIKQIGKMLGMDKIDFKGFLDITKPYPDVEDFRKNIHNAQEHITYLHQDVDILFQFIKKMATIFPMNYWKSTLASSAYHHFLRLSFCTYHPITKKPVPGCLWKLWEKQTGIKIKTVELTKKGGNYWKFRLNVKKYISTKMAKIIFNKLFPFKWLNNIYPKDDENDMDRYYFEKMTPFYRGGLSYVNPDYQGLHLQDVNLSYVDINSSYPSVMMNCQLPIKGIKSQGNLYLAKIYPLTNLVNKYGLPFLPTQEYIGGASGVRTVYPRTIKKGGWFYLPSPEIKRLKKYYQGEFKEEVLFTFDSIKGSDLFKDYINHFWKLKSNATDGVQKFWAKIMLNAVYGKFGEKSHKESKIFNPNLTDNPWEQEEMVYKANKYLPLAIFITSYARCKLIDGVDYNVKNFIYCDTDSLIVNDAPSFNLPISNKIGEWKYEMVNISEAIVRTSKQYKLRDTNGNSKGAFAGTQSLQDQEIIQRDSGISISSLPNLTFDLLLNGGMVGNQVRKNNKIRWGIALENYEKEVKPSWSFEYTFNKDLWFHLPKQPNIPWKKYKENIKDNYKLKYKSQIKKVYKILN